MPAASLLSFGLYGPESLWTASWHDVFCIYGLHAVDPGSYRTVLRGQEDAVLKVSSTCALFCMSRVFIW